MTDFSKAPEKMLKQSILHEILTKDKISSEEKKYTGRGGYHGGGRPRKDEEARRKTISISGTPTEIETIRQLAKNTGKTASRFLIELALSSNL